MRLINQLVFCTLEFIPCARDVSDANRKKERKKAGKGVSWEIRKGKEGISFPGGILDVEVIILGVPVLLHFIFLKRTELIIQNDSTSLRIYKNTKMSVTTPYDSLKDVS